MRSYSINSEVAWGDILHLLRWRIRVLNRDTLNYIADYNRSINHNYPEFTAHYRALACDSFEQVLNLFSIFNGLRKFLKYKTCSYTDLSLDEALAFYETEKKNVSPSDLVRPDTPGLYPPL